MKIDVLVYCLGTGHMTLSVKVQQLGMSIFEQLK